MRGFGRSKPTPSPQPLSPRTGERGFPDSHLYQSDCRRRNRQRQKNGRDPRFAPGHVRWEVVPCRLRRCLHALENRVRGPGREAGGQRVDVLHQVGAGGGAVALPQLDAVDAVVGGEVQRRRRPWRSKWRSEPAAPALMSLTRTVPAAVPSLFHSSQPWMPSSAEKSSVPPTRRRGSGCSTAAAPWLMSLTSTVPARCRRSSTARWPCAPSSAVK